MVDESLAVGVVGIADRAVVVDHAFGPVVEGVLELVLVEGIRPPFREGAGRVARTDRDLRIHQNDLPLDVQAGVIIVAQLRSGDSVSDEDDLGRHLARGRGSAGDELLLVRVGFLDRPVLDRQMKDARSSGKDQRVGIRELLEVRAVVAARGDAPFLQERNHPIGAGVVLGRSGQAAAVFLRRQLLDVFGQGLAPDRVHRRQQLLLVGERRGGRPRILRRGGRRQDRSEDRENQKIFYTRHDGPPSRIPGQDITRRRRRAKDPPGIPSSPSRLRRAGKSAIIVFRIPGGGRFPSGRRRRPDP